MIETVDRIHSPLRSADERAVASPDGSQAPDTWAPGEALSPELVLVDPVLAARARSSLPPAADTLAYLRTRPLRVPVETLPPDNRSLEVPARMRMPRPRRSLGGSIALAAAAVAVVVGLLLSDVHVELGQPSEAADPGAIPGGNVVTTQPSTSGATTSQGVAGKKKTPRPKPTPGRARPAPRVRATAGPRRFAWAPADEASGYRFELFRGASRVFSTEAQGPELTLPASWSDAGIRRTLEPGTYRWYVWPLVSGRRASEAIVRAKLVVPPR
jgi:hypothetical protein